MNEANRISSTKAEIQVLERITRNIGDAPVTVVKPENLRALRTAAGFPMGGCARWATVMLSELRACSCCDRRRGGVGKRQ